MTSALPFFTIGHSNRSIEDFIGLLQSADVGLLADVRTLPGSRAHPQFDEHPLAATLGEAGIAYARMADLGGLRRRSHDVPSSINGFWSNQSFHNYADHALSPAFHHGLERLLVDGSRTLTAVMCSEAVWWRCHRRIISDYLLAAGRTVFHIMGPGRFEPARLTPGAVVEADGSIVYPERDAPPGPASGP